MVGRVVQLIQDRVVVADRCDLYNIGAKFATIEYTIAKVVDKSAKIQMPISFGLALSYKNRRAPGPSRSTAQP